MIHVDKGNINIVGNAETVHKEMAYIVSVLYSSMLNETKEDEAYIKMHFLELVVKAMTIADELDAEGKGVSEKPRDFMEKVIDEINKIIATLEKEEGSNEDK